MELTAQVFLEPREFRKSLIGGLRAHWEPEGRKLELRRGSTVASFSGVPYDVVSAIVDDNGNIRIEPVSLPQNDVYFAAWLCGFKRKKCLSLTDYLEAKSELETTVEYGMGNGDIRFCFRIDDNPRVPGTKCASRACAYIDPDHCLTDEELEMMLAHMQGYITREWAAKAFRERGYRITAAQIRGGKGQKNDQ